MFLSISLERLSGHLAGLGPLMDLYTRREPTFPARALLWLDESEKVMSQLRLPEGAEMSALRGRIVKAEDVARDSEGKPSRKAVTSARFAAASDALSRAEEIMRNRILEAEERLAHFEGKLVEAITAATLMGVVPSKQGGHESWLRQVWQALTVEKAIRPTTIYLAAALPPVDRLYVLDRVMSRLMEQNMSVLPMG